jgi:putative MFS transporter
MVHALAFTAFPVAAVLARLLAGEHNPHGWWLLLVCGSVGALFSWYFRRGLPESPRWLASVGRHAEAAENLARIEKKAAESAAGRSAGFSPLGAVADDLKPALRAAPRVPLWEIWSPRYRGRTVMLVVFQLLQTVGYYGFMHWLAVLFTAKGFSSDEALTMQVGSSLLAPAGPLIAVWAIERWQRKHLIVGLAAVLALGYVAFGLAGGVVLLTLLGAVIVVCSNWFSAVFHAYQAELFPTTARATGVGFTYAWSRVSMVGLNLIMPGLIEAGLWNAFGLMTAAMLGVAGIVGVFGPLTNARPLEEAC